MLARSVSRVLISNAIDAVEDADSHRVPQASETKAFEVLGEAVPEPALLQCGAAFEDQVLVPLGTSAMPAEPPGLFFTWSPSFT